MVVTLASTRLNQLFVVQASKRLKVDVVITCLTVLYTPSAGHRMWLTFLTIFWKRNHLSMPGDEEKGRGPLNIHRTVALWMEERVRESVEKREGEGSENTDWNRMPNCWIELAAWPLETTYFPNTNNSWECENIELVSLNLWSLINSPNLCDIFTTGLKGCELKSMIIVIPGYFIFYFCSQQWWFFHMSKTYQVAAAVRMPHSFVGFEQNITREDSLCFPVGWACLCYTSLSLISTRCCSELVLPSSSFSLPISLSLSREVRQERNKRRCVSWLPPSNQISSDGSV